MRIYHKKFTVHPLRFTLYCLPAGLPSLPLGTIMLPKLGQAIVAKTDGEGAAPSIVKVDSASAAGPVWIELDSILCEANPISTTGIDLGVVWPALWASKFGRIGLKVDMRK